MRAIGMAIFLVGCAGANKVEDGSFQMSGADEAKLDSHETTKTFKVGHATFIDAERAVIGMPGYSRHELRAADGRVLVPFGSSTFEAVEGYGIFVRRIGGARSDFGTPPLQRVDIESGQVVPSDVTDVRRETNASVFALRDAGGRYSLDVVHPGGRLQHYEMGSAKRTGSWERMGKWLVLHAVEGSDRPVDYVLDDKDDPIASPEGGVRVVMGQGAGDYKAIVIAKAPEPGLVWVLGDDGWFAPPAGTLGIQCAFPEDTKNHIYADHWFVAYATPNHGPKRWGIADGYLTTIGISHWAEVQDQSRTYTDADNNPRTVSMVLGQEDGTWTAYVYRTPTRLETLVSGKPTANAAADAVLDANVAEVARQKHAAASYASAQQAVIDKQNEERAWKGESASSTGVSMAWSRAVQAKDVAAMDRIIVLSDNAFAWQQYLEVRPPETLNDAYLDKASKHTNLATMAAVRAALEKRTAQRQQARDAESARLAQQANIGSSSAQSATTSGSYSQKPAWTQGASQEQQMKNYGRWLDQKIGGK